jgi:tripartite-type tricarboxylate transporter receptor subunit TctC
MFSRRSLIAGLSATVVLPKAVWAAWPERPISMVHGFAPGGGADATARIAADGLGKLLGQTVLVESKPGAGTTLAAAQAARAAPDGYTILLATAGFAASAALYKKLSYRPVEDFAGVSLLTEAPYLIATNAEHPAQTLQQMLDLAKAKSGQVTYGTPGVGSGPHLMVELIGQMTGVKFTHVPFRGGAQAVVEVLARRIDFMVDPPLSMIEHVRSGKFRALAVTTAKRSPSFPDTPTVAEAAVPAFEAAAWFGLIGPRGMPDDIVQRLNAACASVLADSAVREKIKGLGAEARHSSPKEITNLIATDIKRWSDVVEKANIERI